MRRGQRHDDDPQTSNDQMTDTPAYDYSSPLGPTSFRGRDSSIRSIPTAEITNTRNSSTTTTRPLSSSMLKNQLTPIPEALPESSPVVFQSTVVKDRRKDSLLLYPSPSTNNNTID